MNSTKPSQSISSNEPRINHRLPITRTRSVFRRNKNLIDESQQPNTTQQQYDDATIKTRNKMLSDIIKAHPEGKIIPSPNKALKVVRENTILIPTSNKQQPTMDRSQVCGYLLNLANCPHDNIHVYCTLTDKNLIDKAIKFIKPEQYGVDYPIVPPSNLRYCKECLKSDDPILIKSNPVGMIKFVSSENTRSKYMHATVPKHVPMNQMIFIDGNDTWINLSMSIENKLSISELKDRLITTVQRKNYTQVIALPPPFESTCQQFDDFGPVVFITSLQDGFDDVGFQISADVDTDNESLQDEPISIIKQLPPRQTTTEQKIECVNGIDRVDTVECKELPATLESLSDFYTSKTDVLSIPLIGTSNNPVPKSSNKLIFPMTTVSDFQVNKQYFTNLGFKVHLGAIPIGISVNVETPLSTQDKCILLESLRNDEYVIVDIHDLQICINNNLVIRWSFTIRNPDTLGSTENLQVQNELLIHYISNKLECDADESIIPIVTMLEKSYLQRKSSHDCMSNIVLDYTTPSKSSSISYRDLNAFYKSSFSQAIVDERDPSTHITYLLMYLMYCSIIPQSLLVPSNEGITILVE